MKTNLLLISLFFCLSAISQVTPKISNIKVFANGAEIERKANVKVKSGLDTLTIEGLSPYVRQHTIQAKLPGIKIVDLKYSINNLKSEQDAPKIKQIKSQIKSVEKNILDLEDQLSYLKIEKDLILSNKKISESDALDIDDVKDFVAYYKTNMPSLIGKITDTKAQIKKFKTVKSKLLKQQKELQRIKSTKTGEIQIVYQSKQNRQTNLNIKYHVYNCGWSPLYNMRASNIGKPIQFEYNALVYQNTGINWSNVKLNITTGNPVLNGNKPDLNSWRLNGITEYKMRRSQQVLKAYEAPQLEGNAEDTRGLKGANKELQLANNSGFSSPIQTQNLTFSSFEIPGKFNLVTGSGNKNVNILSKELPASYQYFAVPKKNNNVYLIAQVTNWNDMPLIPGKSHIYFDETFVGKSYLNPQVMSDTLDISLGRDQSILVERLKQEGVCKNNSNLLGVTKTRGYDVIVKNNRSVSIKIQILDQVPISNNNKIKVEHKLGTGWVLTEETGILEWNLEVPASEKKSASFEFEVKHPKKINVPL